MINLDKEATHSHAKNTFVQVNMEVSEDKQEIEN